MKLPTASVLFLTAIAAVAAGFIGNGGFQGLLVGLSVACGIVVMFF
jgi:hypothetical protein